MHRWREWLTSRALSLAPVRELLSRAGDAIREARSVQRASLSESELLLAEELQYQRHQLRTRMNEMIMLREAELACLNPKAYEHLRESGALSAPVTTPAQLKERMWELELALEDRGWIRETTLAMLEFSRYGVQQLIRISRIYALKNPIIKRGAEICRMYVFGRGIEMRAEDETANETIQDFLKLNAAELSHTALANDENSIQTDGALYFALPTNPQGEVMVRTIDPLEIMDVLTDPDDTGRVWYFLRHWNHLDIQTASGTQYGEPKKAWYPSLSYLLSNPKEKPATLGDVPVNWEMPIHRVHGGGSPAKWRWPVPPIYAAIDWARAYKDFLEDWATVQKSLARFAINVQTSGGPAAIAAYQAVLSTTFADAGGTQIERNPPPAVGAAHVSGPDNKITPFKTSGTQEGPEQARRVLLMAAAATGLPETFFGDASTGSLATAQSLDRPTELKFREIQQRWVETLTRILEYVLMVAGQTPGTKMREARAQNPAPQPVQIVIKFPAVLEHDIGKMVQAWVDIGTNGGRQGIYAGGIDRRTLVDGMLAEVGYENRTQLLDAIYGTDYDPKADVEDQRTQQAPQAMAPPGSGKGEPQKGTPPPEKGAAAQEALLVLREIRERVQTIGNGHAR
jgi:hypothetical protein